MNYGTLVRKFYFVNGKCVSLEPEIPEADYTVSIIDIPGLPGGKFPISFLGKTEEEIKSNSIFFFKLNKWFWRRYRKSITAENIVEAVKNLVGEFTWDFGKEFFIETEIGNLIWKDPSYIGDNSIEITSKSYEDWVYPNFGRSKGTHVIGDYIRGENVKIIGFFE